MLADDSEIKKQINKSIQRPDRHTFRLVNTRSAKRSRSNSFLTDLVCRCSGVALVHRNHCWVWLGPTRLVNTFSVASNFSITERSTNCTAESHCCLSWTERSSSVLSWITRRTSAACWCQNQTNFTCQRDKKLIIKMNVKYFIFPLMFPHRFVNDSRFELIENVVMIFRQFGLFNQPDEFLFERFPSAFDTFPRQLLVGPLF